jgi:hypothetical protein
MSCERAVGKVAALAPRAGVQRLASKKAFYIGVAAGAAGLAVGGLAALVRHLGRGAQPGGGTAPRDGREASALPARAQLMPTPLDQVTDSCMTCRASPRSKPGLWYLIEGHPYCQDCAPSAARQAGASLGLPASRQRAFNRLAFLAGMQRPRPEEDDGSFSPAQRVTLSRVESRVRVRVTTDDESVGRWYFHERAYLLLDGQGQATGLAITPAVDVLRDSAGDPVTDERGRAMLRSSNYNWYLTHVGSGRAIAGPYRNPNQAHGLAEVLAQLDWKRDRLSSFSRQERWHIWRALSDYEPGLGAYRVKFRPAAFASPHDRQARR